MKLAVSGYEFDDMTFAKISQFLNGLGVRYLELWPENVANESEADVLASLNEYDIKISCVSATSQFRLNAEPVDKAQEAIWKAIDLASTFGAKLVTTYLGGNPERDLLTTLKLYKKNLQPCLREAASREITILLENMFDHRNEDPHGAKPSRYAEGTRAIYDLIDSEHFGITYDPVNFYICGVEAYPYAYELLSNGICNLHLKDTKKYNELLHGNRADLPIWEDYLNGPYVSVPVGQGTINWEGIMRRLEVDGYQGYTTVDILTQKTCREQAYYESVKFMKNQLDQRQS